ncbi:nicotinamide mononucleotide transporter family protein [Deinococcus yavapaiensis]|uniref:Nicotinamide mononucleotide transporter n=1 Tax=Deinococcus yavapaiensis KR-236 TaxID=694435 RepID=A0A318S763_9DEIO|nr:nicotinamide mononucleotide transporter family protein [Deinococcus yavapaiensis]PYE53527.1 nicotinamide mononucleotide transporter [Deinococcus yavapaiensis KR-236]
MNIPQWALDWSGSLCVVVSLVYLWRKSSTYWHWSNLSLLPYFLLFASSAQWMLAGLQITYLLFGIHGLYLWYLESRKSKGEIRFNEPLWYGVTWAASLAIFAYTVAVTDFREAWNWVQFASVTLALVANFGTTRKRTWSWPVWMLVNAVSAVYFQHLGLWAQFGLQFVLAALSVWGWREWARQDEKVARVATV